MPLDGVFAHFLARELNSQLSGSRIDRIFQSDRTDIQISMRGQGRNYRLMISANTESPRIHVTRHAADNPAYPPMFCMLLRKHLVGARLLEVSTEGWERVFVLKFQNTDELGDSSVKKLIVEIMGRHSNVILVNEAGIILDAAVHVDDTMSRIREVLPARHYLPPPPQVRIPPEEVFLQLSRDPGSLLAVPVPARNIELTLLETLQGFSPALCREACHLAGIDGKRAPGSLSIQESTLLGQGMSLLLGYILAGDVHPSIYKLAEQDAAPVDFHAIILTASGVREERRTLSEAVDDYFEARLQKNRYEQKRKKLSQSISARLSRALRKAEAHRSDIQSCEGYMDHRRFGEFILVNLHSLEEGITGFYAADYESALESRVWVPLDEKRKLTQNAQRYFRLYAKSKARISAATRMLSEDLEQVDYLRSLMVAVENAADDTDFDALREEWESFAASEGDGIQEKQVVKKTSKSKKQARPVKKKAPEPAMGFRTYVSSDGFPILVGRNNIQNDRLTFRTADRDDLWLHVQKEPGTHVIVRTGHREVPDRTLLEAAAAAAWFSRPGGNAAVRGTSGAAPSIAVDYCPVRQVRKMSGAKPGMVIYENYRTLLVRPVDPASLNAPEVSDP